MIPSEIKWDPNATPPQFTNNEDMVIEKGTQVRVKIIGIRSEVGEMWAIGSIKEDYLGYVAATSVALFLFFWRRMGGIVCCPGYLRAGPDLACLGHSG